MTVLPRTPRPTSKNVTLTSAVNTRSDLSRPDRPTEASVSVVIPTPASGVRTATITVTIAAALRQILGIIPARAGAPLFVEPCDLVEGGSHECDAFCVDAGLFFGDPFVPAPLPGR